MAPSSLQYRDDRCKVVKGGGGGSAAPLQKTAALKGRSRIDREEARLQTEAADREKWNRRNDDKSALCVFWSFPERLNVAGRPSKGRPRPARYPLSAPPAAKATPRPSRGVARRLVGGVSRGVDKGTRDPEQSTEKGKSWRDVSRLKEVPYRWLNPISSVIIETCRDGLLAC